MNRINGLILTTVLALALCSIAASFFTASLAQPGRQDPARSRKLTPACSCFCGGLNPNYINLFSAEDIAAGKCFGGPLPADKCGETLGSLPPEELTSICDYVTEQHKSPSVCPTVAPYCKPKEKQPPDTKCEPPRNRNRNPPWLNQDLPCQNRQQATYSWAPYRRDPTVNSVSINICGQVIRYVTSFATEMTRLGFKSFDVCCDSWNTGTPCDAQRDIDCDGTLNESDLAPFQAPLRRGSSDDFVINSPRSGLPFWREIYEGMPSQSDCKDCKWELVDVQYTCKEEVERTGRRSETINAEYKYQATWKCPANGQTQVTNNSATMEGRKQRRGSPCCRCPSPPSGSWP